MDYFEKQHLEQRLLVRSIVLSTAISLAVVLVGALVFIRYAPVDELVLEQKADELTITPASGDSAIVRDAGLPMAGGELQIVELVEAVNPAVVSVVITKDMPVFEDYFEEFNPFGGFFGEDFSFRIPQRRQQGTERLEVGGGSGFFVSGDGLIVTNRHVVEDVEADYSILTNDGESIEVEVLARDPVLDIAVLKARGELPEGGYTFVPFGDSSELKQGQTAIAIGNALGEFRNSVSVGVISGLARSIIAGDGMGMSEQLDEVIQTDAAINPGNSGGPLLNSSGQVIGVNVAVAFGSENIGFALPANVVADIVASVEEFGEIVRPFLGVRYVEVNERIAELEELSVDYGALVTRGETAMDIAVMPDSAAAKAGLQAGDVLIELDGETLRERSLASLIRNYQVGDTVEVRYVRGGEELVATVVLERAPE